MPRAVVVLGGFGALLGGLGAVGWHWVPAFGERIGSPIRPRPGQVPLYSGVVTDDQVIHWVSVWWPVVVVLPLLGAAAGAGWGAVVARRHAARPTPSSADVPREAGDVIEAVGVAMLGLLLGVLSAVAWHYQPGSGSWAGLLEERADLGYPATGLALAVVFLLLVRPDGAYRWRAGLPPRC